MKHDLLIVSYLILMGAVIILVDALVLRDRFWWRLVTNVSIVAVFALIYLLFLRDAFES